MRQPSLHRSFFKYNLLLLIGCFLLPNCTGKTEQQNSHNNIALSEIINVNLHKFVPIDSIINEPEIKYPHSILYTSRMDCSSCVHKGYTIINSLDSTGYDEYTSVIYIGDNPGFEQIRNNYLKYVYKDESNIFRKYLKAILTPSIFIFDSTSRIIDIQFLNVGIPNTDSIFKLIKTHYYEK